MTTELSLLGLLLRADIVVKVTLLLLLLASLVCWAIIIDQSVRLRHARREARRFGQAVQRGLAPQHWTVPAKRAGSEAAASVSDAILAAGMDELSEDRAPGQREDAGQRRERVERSMRLAMSEELRALEGRLPFLATVGSTAPFVGLFGTVWGIMNAFLGIAHSNDTSLAVVAPGIAEALFATAIGLAAAIPAVVAYNKLGDMQRRLAQELTVAVARASTRLARQAPVAAATSVAAE
ncbi:MAG: MotA/TolQ/ExbB proton channel family protein [Alphaproteobacteria bacterium]|nr:MotA/TolQ/ExbB proton channel family protein [Alphaproteobacteria bacterium]